MKTQSDFVSTIAVRRKSPVSPQDKLSDKRDQPHGKKVIAPDYRYLVLVPCHGVYVGTERRHAYTPDYWISKFRNEGEFYTEHLMAGLKEAAQGQQYMFMPSGGMTMWAAGPVSEGESYWFLADQFNWGTDSSIRNRTFPETFARDSFENLLFSIARYVKLVGEMPKDIIICGWAFKKERYAIYADALRLRNGQMHYLEVNMPIGKEDDLKTPRGLALAGERNALSELAISPVGNTPAMNAKREARDPFHMSQDIYAYYKVNRMFPHLAHLLRK